MINTIRKRCNNINIFGSLQKEGIGKVLEYEKPISGSLTIQIKTNLFL